MLLLSLSFGCNDQSPPQPAKPIAPARPVAAPAPARSIKHDPQAQRDLAAISREIKRYGYPMKSQIARLNQLHELDPQDDQVIQLLDAGFRGLKDYQGLYNLHSSLPNEKHTPYHKFYLGYLLNKISRYQDAAAMLEPILIADPGNVKAALQAAVAYSRIHRYDDARALLTRYQGRIEKINAVQVATIWGSIHTDAGDFEKALGWYQQAIRIAPDSSVLHAHMVRALYAQGDDAQAQVYAQKVKQLKKTELESSRWGMTVLTMLAAWRSNHDHEALRIADRLITMTDDPVCVSTTHLIKHHIHIRLGDRPSADKEMKQALAWREKALAQGKRPITPQARTLLGTANKMMQKGPGK